MSPKSWDHFRTVTSPRRLPPRSDNKRKLCGSKVLESDKETNCAVVDGFELLGIVDGFELLGGRMEDHCRKYIVYGMHLNGDGNNRISNRLASVIRK